MDAIETPLPAIERQDVRHRDVGQLLDMCPLGGTGINPEDVDAFERGASSRVSGEAADVGEHRALLRARHPAAKRRSHEHAADSNHELSSILLHKETPRLVNRHYLDDSAARAESSRW